MSINLFQIGRFRSHSGIILPFKIECDALQDGEWKAVAEIIGTRFHFSDVAGVPQGGLKLANYLVRYRKDDQELPKLIVDDVLTTGESMVEFRKMVGWPSAIGVVLFARGKAPFWIHPVFQYWGD